MKNYNECLRMDLVSPSGADPTSIVSGKTDIKIQQGAIYDTTSSADAFSSLSAGDTVKISGWDKPENNVIAEVVAVESGGQWFKVNAALVDVLEGDIPADGIDVDKSTDVQAVNDDMTKYDHVNDAIVMTSSASSPSDVSPDNMGVVKDGQVAFFDAGLEDNDQLLVLWSDNSRG